MLRHDTPYPFDLVRDDDFERLVRSLCTRPRMYVIPGRDLFAAVSAYLEGYVIAKDDAPLVGFQQWLVVRANGGNNVRWPGTHRQDLEASGTGTSDEELVSALGDLIVNFLEFRRQHGLTVIFRNYAEWLLRQSWYDGPLRTQT